MLTLVQNETKSFWCEEAALGSAGAGCGVSDALAYSRVFARGCLLLPSNRCVYGAGCEAEQLLLLRRGQCHINELLPYPCWNTWRGNLCPPRGPRGSCRGAVLVFMWDPGTSFLLHPSSGKYSSSGYSS